MKYREPPHPRLDELQPAWVPETSPEWGGEGVACHCVNHGPPCRMLLLFQNPLTGHKPGPALPHLPRYFRIGSSFASLTLMSPIDLGSHFRGHLIEGEFLPELVLH